VNGPYSPSIGDAKPEIEDFMQLMDRELSRTNVGKSFEKRAKPVSSATGILL